MIVYCLKDGVTANERVYMRGELFKLPEVLVKELGDLIEDQLARRQKRIYGELLFRRPTSEELRLGFVAKLFKLNDLSDKEKRELAIALKARKTKENEVIEFLEKTPIAPSEVDEIAEEAGNKPEGA